MEIAASATLAKKYYETKNGGDIEDLDLQTSTTTTSTHDYDNDMFPPKVGDRFRPRHESGDPCDPVPVGYRRVECSSGCCGG